MSAPGGPPPPVTPPVTAPATAPGTPTTLTNEQTSGVMAVFGVLAFIPLLLLLFFHLGAGYLSYQKYGSMLWAVVNFIFAYFYYPYYAFFLARDPSPQPMGMLGGMAKLFKGAGRRR
jgi:hypothetical protein